MNVLYFHQFFKTPTEGGSIRSYLLARTLVENGHEVTMITTHNAPKTVKNIAGIRVIYLHVPYDNTYKFWRRIIAFLSYSYLACRTSIRHKAIDCCYIMTTPLTTGMIGLFNKFFYKRPYFFEVGDLWPLVPIEMGFIRARPLKYLTRWMEKTFYRHSIGNIGMSPPITSHIQSIAPSVATETIYNISDCAFFQPTEKQKSTNEFVICYTGTFGLANDLFRVISIAEQVQNLPIRFVMVGAGADKPAIEQLIADKQLKNVEIRGFSDKKAMAKLMEQSDAMLISFANYSSLFTGSPNKLFDALAAGKLIITNFDGWIAELIYQAKCGVHFVHDSSDSFKEKITPFLDNPELLHSYQINSRQLAERQFDLKLQAPKFLSFVERLVHAKDS
ncbi:glycosyltransferase family 4 protein [Reichenbachiella agariperforans]|uniref:glycosyltransferase family 4 protein n=1 Tax=Reichenbachiella agariperforans TaxID=156994 RepID=UPI001C082C07|nr:glycosyltransferase family 4 protein [Reichenbachiella agariperforans]MBU2915969.1 glycosyltransferase family 4 protein [Reichenbachiella agariperforans]